MHCCRLQTRCHRNWAVFWRLQRRVWTLAYSDFLKDVSIWKAIETERQRDFPSTWLSLIPATARVGPIQTQEPSCPFRSPTWWAGSHALRPLSATFPGTLGRSSIGNRGAGSHMRSLIWAAGIWKVFQSTACLLYSFRIVPEMISLQSREPSSQTNPRI